MPIISKILFKMAAGNVLANKNKEFGKNINNDQGHNIFVGACRTLFDNTGISCTLQFQ